MSEGHLGSRCPLRVLPLTPTHRHLRWEWCRARGNWIAAEWNQVVLSDESRFNLSSDDNRVRVWKHLVLIRGTITAQQYVHDILQPHVLPLPQRLPGAIFQQDNALPHTANVSEDSLRIVTTLPWTARSPDLSPIEHIWDHLGWQVGHPTSLNEVEAKLQQICNEMSQDIIQNY
ncbi:transposable element Tcb2 transposase [Trichonephila clavipes]|nr:transposable element Tcb2 transposase [Trichonephila clavipes]